MDWQAQLALKGIKVQNFFHHPVAKHVLIVTYSYKWVTPIGEVRWDNGFVYMTWPGPSCGESYEDYTCQRILAQVEKSREYLKDKTPEVL